MRRTLEAISRTVDSPSTSTATTKATVASTSTALMRLTAGPSAGSLSPALNGSVVSVAPSPLTRSELEPIRSRSALSEEEVGVGLKLGLETREVGQLSVVESLDVKDLLGETLSALTDKLGIDMEQELASSSRAKADIKVRHSIVHASRLSVFAVYELYGTYSRNYVVDVVVVVLGIILKFAPPLTSFTSPSISVLCLPVLVLVL